MPTLVPGKNFVPRWRTITLPAAIASPPNFFTPSRWPAESRPLREEPPAFLCAMGSLRFVIRGRVLFVLRVSVVRRDLQLREGLAMAALAMGVLAALLLEGHDL